MNTRLPAAARGACGVAALLALTASFSILHARSPQQVRKIAAPAADPSSTYGIVDGTGVPTTQRAVTLAREAGIGWVNLAIFWNRVNPGPGVYHWEEVDRQLQQIENAGLNVYARVEWPPAWTLGVSYPNENAPYYCYDPTAPLNVRQVPDCLTDHVPDSIAFDTFIGDLITRYGLGPNPRIPAFGFGREVHSRVFWQGSTTQFVRDYLRPAYVRVKNMNPALTIVGPDEDSAASLNDVLALEPNYGTIADVISFHILRHSLPDGSMVNRLDTELKPVIQARGNGRPVWLTELGMASATYDCLTNGIAGEWLRLRLEELTRPEYSWITKAFIFSLKDSTTTQDFGILGPDDAQKPAWYAVRSLTGAAVLSTSSYLAEGATGAFFDLDLAIANPTCQPAPVTIRYLKADGTTVNDVRNVPGLTRLTVSVDNVAGMGSTATSSIVESSTGVPLVAERTMFWDSTYYGGHGGSAVASPSSVWYFAEGSQGFFDTYILLANSTSAPASVSVTFLRESASPLVRDYVVAPTSRFNIFAGDDPELRGYSFSTAITSTQPIIAERAMYFGTARFWDAGHESAGVTQPATTWYHAEGATGPFFDTYILLGNPNSAQANVTATYLIDTGTVITKTYAVPAFGRLTIDVEAQDPVLANAAMSTTITSDVPIISERAMYWPGNFTTWGEAHNSFGVTATGTKWALAEGRVGSTQAFDTYVLVANTGSTEAQVRVTYLRTPAMGPPIVKLHTIAPTSRFNIHVNEVPELSNEHFGVLVESLNGAPLIVERAMYWDALGLVWAGGTNVAAIRLQ